VALTALAALGAACSFGGDAVVALEGATLIDGSGGRPIEDAIVLVRDGRIEAVARVGEIKPPRGATVVNLVGKTIIPGLIDVHVELTPWAATRFLAWGVTTVRDLGADSTQAYRLRDELNGGAALGPRVFTSGGIIDGDPPVVAAADPAPTPEAGRRAVDRRAVTGTDWIAVSPTVTADVLTAVLDEAGTFRFPTAARLGRIDALAAAQAGVATIEALSGIPQAAGLDPGPILRALGDPRAAWRAEATGWTRLDSARIATIGKALAQTRVSLVPALVQLEALAHLGDRAFIERPQMADVPGDAVAVRDAAAARAALGWTPTDAQLLTTTQRAQALFLREFRRAGGLMGAGSTAAGPLLIPGFSLHEELALLVGAGFEPLSVIATATRRNAQLLRADSLGWVAPGKVADLVILNGRPDSSIFATRDIHLVMVRGTILNPDSLRASWGR